MQDTDHFDRKLRVFRADCNQAYSTFAATLDWLSNNASDKYEASRGLINALIAILIDVAYAKERIGLNGSVAATREMIMKSFDDFEPVNFGVAGDRLVAVVAAYNNDFRPATGGKRESRMQAALTFAARMEQGSTVAEMVIEVSRDLEPIFDFDAVDKGAVAIAQSIKRMRNTLRKNDYCRFDPSSLRLEIAKPEDELWRDLPKGRGRPKSKRN